jgi:glycine cleavage system H protein
VVKIQDDDFPEHLLYDIENQIWYEPLADRTIRAGFTPWAVTLMGEVLVFTPKRLGHTFEKERWFAMVEGGKWVGAARAAFDGTVVAQNEALVDKPALLMSDPYHAGWMLLVRAADDGWRTGLVTGADVGPAMERWIAGGSYTDRSG